MAAFVATLGIVFWEVFFLIPVGRAAFFRACPPPVQLFDLIYRTQKNSQFIVKVTGHHRRHVAQRERRWRAAGRTQGVGGHAGDADAVEGPGHTVGLAPVASTRETASSSCRIRATSSPAAFCRSR